MINTIGTVDALQSLKPNAQWTIQSGVIDWHDTEQTEPTQAEIDAEIIRLQTEYDSQEYARNRKDKYDALNQFELISDDSINGTTTHKDAILAIKAAHPKP